MASVAGTKTRSWFRLARGSNLPKQAGSLVPCKEGCRIWMRNNADGGATLAHRDASGSVFMHLGKEAFFDADTDLWGPFAALIRDNHNGGAA